MRLLILLGCMCLLSAAPHSGKKQPKSRRNKTATSASVAATPTPTPTPTPLGPLHAAAASGDAPAITAYLQAHGGNASDGTEPGAPTPLFLAAGGCHVRGPAQLPGRAPSMAQRTQPLTPTLTHSHS
jgi:hypothetical protein